MRMRFCFAYDQLPKLTPDQYARLRELIPELPANVSEASAYMEYEADIEKVLDIVGRVNSVGYITPYPVNVLAHLADKVKEISLRQSQPQTINQKVDVHVPGLGLLMMDEVTVLEDGCTDTLQEKLDAGWRILSICPQPDQRRPDYVIGRKKSPE